MSRVRSVVMLVGGIIMCLATAVTTYFGLLSFGVIEGESHEIVVTIDSQSKEYDGTPLNSTTYTYSTEDLDPEHTLEVIFLNEITNVGTVDIRANVIIEDKAGVDVTDKYNVVIKDATYTIKPREIKITYNSNSKEYDGTPLEETTYKISGSGLVNGHKLVNEFDNSVENVGDSEIVNAKPSIFADNGADVTSNYKIVIESASAYLEIEPRTLNIEINDYQKNYDGNGVYAKDLRYQVSGLLVGHTFDFSTEFENRLSGLVDIAPAGDYIVDLDEDSYDIYDLSGKSVKEQYAEFTTTFSVTINPATITDNVTIEKDYNGESHKESIINQLNIKYANKLNGNNITDIKLVDSNTKLVYEDYTNAVSDKNCSLSLVIKTPNGIIISDNYDINIILNLTINKRKLDLYGYSTDKEYSDDPIRVEGEIDENRTTGLLPGHEVSITYKDLTEINKIGTYPTEIEDIDEDIEIYDGSDDVTANYEIRYYKGVVTIYQKIISVNLGQLTHKYNGQPVELDLTDNSDDDIKEIATSNTFELPIDYINVADSFSKPVTNDLLVYNSDGEINRNYKIEATYSIKITPIDLNLYNGKPIPLGNKDTGILMKVYDGKAITLTKDDYSVLLQALRSQKAFEDFDITNVILDKEYINVDDTNVTDEIKEAILAGNKDALSNLDYTQYLKNVTATIVDADGKDVSANFNVTAAYFVYINPLPIWVSYNMEKTFDGELPTLLGAPLDITDGALVYELSKETELPMTADMLAAYKAFTKNYKVLCYGAYNLLDDAKNPILLVGTHTATFNEEYIKYVIKYSDDSFLTTDDPANNNYEFMDATSKIIVNPCEINVDLEVLTKVEDGTPLTLGDREKAIVQAALPDGFTVESVALLPDPTKPYITVSKFENQNSLLICDIRNSNFGDVNVSFNFVITADYTVKITKEANVEMNLTKTYDSLPYALTDDEVLIIKTKLGLDENYEFTAKLAKDYVDVCKWNKPQSEDLVISVYHIPTQTDLTELYTAKLECKLEINPLIINVQSSATKTYDSIAITPNDVLVLEGEYTEEQLVAYEYFVNNYKLNFASYINDDKYDLVNCGTRNAKLDLSTINVTAIDGSTLAPEAYTKLQNYYIVEESSTITIEQKNIYLEYEYSGLYNANTVMFDLSDLANSLCGNDKLNDTKFPGNIYNTTYINVGEYNNVLVNSYFELSSNYNVEVIVNVEIKPIEVDLSSYFPSVSKVYDGKAVQLFTDAEQLANVKKVPLGIDGFAITDVQLVGSYINVADSKEDVELAVYVNEKIDSNFKFIYDYDINITKRDLVIKSSNRNVDYTGTKVSVNLDTKSKDNPEENAFTIDKINKKLVLATGDILEYEQLVFDKDYIYVKDSTKSAYVDLGEYSINNGLINVEDNYNVIFESCEINIYQYELTFEIKFEKKFNDKKVLLVFDEDDEVYKLGGKELDYIFDTNDTIKTLKLTKDYLNVSDSENNVDIICTIVDEDGIDVTENYIVKSNINIKIKPEELEFGFPIEKVYDGEAATVDYDELNDIINDELGTSQIQYLRKATLAQKCVDAGTYNDVLVNLFFTSEYVGNYDAYVVADITITPVTIDKPLTIKKEYDGEEATVDLSFIQSKLGIDDVIVGLGLTNVCDTTIIIDSADLGLDEDNYDINIEVDLEITPIIIDQSFTVNKVYDGEELTIDLSFVQSRLAKGDSLSSVIYSTGIKGVYDNTYIIDEDDLDLSSNYDVNIEVDITITKITIEEYLSVTKVYDGDFATVDLSVIQSKLAKSDSLVSMIYTTAIMDVNDSDTVYIDEADLGLDASCYDVYIEVDVTIKPIVINETFNINKVYDGKEVLVNLTSVANQLTGSDSLSSSYITNNVYETNITDVETTTFTLGNNQLGLDSNYAATVTIGVSVTPVVINEKYTINKVYDGNNVIVDLRAVENQLLDTDTLGLVYDQYDTNESDVCNKTIILDNDTFNLSNNYKLIISIDLTITPVIINKTYTVNKVYDGTSAKVNLSEVNAQILAGSVLNNVYDTEKSNVGNETIVLTQNDFVSSSYDDNYKINVSIDIVITPIVINKTYTVNKVYDGKTAKVNLSEVNAQIIAGQKLTDVYDTNLSNVDNETIVLDQDDFVTSTYADNYKISVVIEVVITPLVITENYVVNKVYDAQTAKVNLSTVAVQLVGDDELVNSDISNNIYDTGFVNVCNEKITLTATDLSLAANGNYKICITIDVTITKMIVNVERSVTATVDTAGDATIYVGQILNGIIPNINSGKTYIRESAVVGTTERLILTEVDLGLSDNYVISFILNVTYINE